MRHLFSSIAKIFTCLLLMCTGMQTAFAADDQDLTSKLEGSAGQLIENAYIETVDLVYDNTQTRSRINLSYPQYYNNTVTLLIDEKSLTYIPVNAFTCTVTLDIQYTTPSGSIVNVNGKVLTITYNKSEGAKYDALQYYHFTNGYKVKVTVRHISTTVNGTAWDVTKVIRLENRMKISRDYNFGCSEFVTGVSSSTAVVDGTSVEGTGTITQGSDVITDVANASDIIPGALIAGERIPANTTVVSVGTNSITLSQMITEVTGSNTFVAVNSNLLEHTGNITTGSNVITGVTNIAGIVTGALITGERIPGYTTVTAVGTNSITLSQNIIAVNGSNSFVVTGDVAKISWTNNANSGLTHFDIEWAWIDGNAIGQYSTTSGGITTYYSGKIFTDNSTRVTVANNFPGDQTPNYSIPMLYDGTGYLFYRVRPVQYLINGKVVNGAWSNINGVNQGYFVFSGHQPNMNWQASTIYAEEGKRKTVIQYFDGTLRNRQTVTKDNTSNTTVVAETFYDYQGRPAIQVLPAPTLNTIIQYAKDFNQFENLSSINYQKDIYDLIDQAATICDNRTAAMLTNSGAAQYYSPNNPKVNVAENKFIPDAQGYPYTETRYSQDATGRVIAQGGVGPMFQLGTNASGGYPDDHSTKYFYGTANQKELDALFGTEVGDASHYFKNMVKDPNGQYSVSYVDMTGKTVATALAGKSPDNLSPLESHEALSNDPVTEDMLNNTTDGKSIISTKTLLVPEAQDYHFQYSLNPQSAAIVSCSSSGGEVSTICYDCLYDLEITITGCCNQDPIVYTKKNFSLNSIGQIDNLDENCNNASPSLVINAVVPLKEGEYTITKKLTLSSQAESWYREKTFAENNICRTFKQIYDSTYDVMISQSDCAVPDCDKCRIALGDLPGFQTKFLISQGLDPASPISEQLAAEIRESYKENNEACENLCKTNLSKLDGLRMQLLADMTPPNGQYAKKTYRPPGDDIVIEYETWPYNIYNVRPGVLAQPGHPHPRPFTSPWGFYKDELGIVDHEAYSTNPDGSLTPKYTVPKDFEQNYASSWIESLLPYHPEYPRYLAMTTILKASYDRDENIESNTNSYAAAVTAHFTYTGIDNLLLENDPFFSGVGAAYKLQMRQAIETDYTGLNKPSLGLDPSLHLSIWQIAWAKLHCENSTTDGSCITGAPKTPAGFGVVSGCEGDWDKVWQTFRTLYFTLKREFINDYLNANYPNTYFDQVLRDYHDYQRRIGGFSTFRNIDPYLSQLDGSNGTNTPPVITSTLTDLHKNTCDGYKQLWLQELRTCDALNNNTTEATNARNEIMTALSDICQASFDDNHPYGAANRLLNDTRQYKTFEQAITNIFAAHHIDITSLCHPFLISYPRESDKQAPPSDGVAVLEKDDCVCSRLSEMSTQKTQSSYPGNLSSFIKYRYGVAVRQGLLDTLINGCNNIPACKTYKEPLQIPGLLTCYGPQETCIDCDKYHNLLSSFKTDLPGMINAPYEAPGTQAEQDANMLFEKYMNYKTGFTKGWAEYMYFGKKCDSVRAPLRCTYLDSLVTQFKDSHPDTVYFGQSCVNLFISFFNQATGRHDTWNDIVALYAQCGGGPDICTPVITCYRFNAIIEEFRYSYYGPTGIGQPGEDCQQSFVNFFNQRYGTIYTWAELVWKFRKCGTIDVCEQFSCRQIELLIAQFKQTAPWLYPDCENRFVLFFNQHFGTNFDLEKIREICGKCIDDFSFCNPNVDCKQLDLYLKMYENGEYHCVSQEKEGTPAYCKDCFTKFMNSKLGQNYTYEQILYIFKKWCDKKVGICEDNFTCDALTEFIKAHEYKETAADCRPRFIRDFNEWFKTNYNYDQIMSVFLLYCGNMPVICSSVVIDNCEPIWNFYSQFIEIVRDPSGYYGSGATVDENGVPLPDSDPNKRDPSNCTQAFTDQFNSHFGTDYDYDQIMQLYLSLCKKEPELCDPRYCGDMRVFKAAFIAKYGQYTLPQQLKKDLFTYLFNIAFKSKTPYTWADIINAYANCGSSLINVAPADNGPLLDCSKIAGLRDVYYEFNPGSLSGDCKDIFQNLFDLYYQTDMKYGEIILWASDNCGQDLDVCGSHALEGERIVLGKQASARVIIGGVALTNTEPRLCGLNMPVNPPVTEPPIEPCSYVSTMALNSATEQYNLFVQHQKGNFNKEYEEKCLAAKSIESFTVSYKPKEYHYTLYYYDQAGNLVKTVPPAGVHPNRDAAYLDAVQAYRDGITNTAPAVPSHTLETQYRYNSLNQVTAQYSPDANEGHFWYDRLGRLVVSQNAKQAVLGTNHYSYTLYDDLNRIKEVGQVTQTTPMNSDISKNDKDKTVLGSLANWLDNKAAEQITRTFYDLSYIEGNDFLCPEYMCQKNLRNRVSYTSLYPTGTPGGEPVTPDHSAATYYSYDIHGNIDVLLQDMNQGYMKYKDPTLTGTALEAPSNASGSRFKKITYDYDLISGKVNEVTYQPDYYNETTSMWVTPVDQYNHRYTYDAENRITDVETSRDKVYWEKDARYSYYKHGSLARTILGENQVQGLDYAYTLQGWLKGINSTSVGDGSFDMGEDGKLTGINSLVARDAFGFSLNYFGGDYKPVAQGTAGFANPFTNITALPTGGKNLYNGNISSMVINLPKLEAAGADAAKVYGFGYDQLNRLLAMDVYEGINNATNTFTPITINNQYQEQLKYDANGNILEYKRNGNGNTVFLNNYKYNYTAGTNRLQSIDKRDAVNVVTANKTYSYDDIGNTTADEMQSVNNAVWNVYGKLQSCTNKTGQNIAYTYGADGKRISKTVAGVTEFYVNDATGKTMATYKKDPAINSNHLTTASFDKHGSIYLGSIKVNVDMEATSNTGITVFTRGITEYVIADHRGNNMLAISDKKIAYSSNSIDMQHYTADVLTASYYSAYGAISKSFNEAEINRAHNGQKRSQEISEFAQTALYWEYNGDVGRRWNMDPIFKEWESPYSCFSDNPICLIDIDGDDAGRRKKEKSTAKNPKQLDEVVVRSKSKRLSKTPNLKQDYSEAITGDLKALGVTPEQLKEKLMDKIKDEIPSPFPALPPTVKKAIGTAKSVYEVYKIMKDVQLYGSRKKFPAAFMIGTIVEAMGGPGAWAAAGAKVMQDDLDDKQREMEESLLQVAHNDPTESFDRVQTLLDRYNSHYMDGFVIMYISRKDLIQVINDQSVMRETLKTVAYDCIYNGQKHIIYSHMIYMKKSQLANPFISIENIGYIPTGIKVHDGEPVKVE